MASNRVAFAALITLLLIVIVVVQRGLSADVFLLAWLGWYYATRQTWSDELGAGGVVR